MIKVLITEDEPEIVNELLSSIDWVALGFEICGTANNGEQAYKLAYELEPDIIILDIGLPQMNGLEVLEKLRADGNRAQVIILSGYNDFQYAKQAIHLGAADYLLKPCPFDDLTEALIKVKNKILQAESNKQQFDAMHNKIKNIHEKIRQNLIIDIIKGNIPAYERLEHYDINLSNDAVSILIFEYKKEKSNEDIPVKIKKIFSEFFETDAAEYDNRIIIVIKTSPLKETEMRTKIHNAAVLINKQLSPYGYEFCGGTGNSVTGYENWAESFSQAEAALDASYIYGQNTIYLYKDISPMLNTPWKYPMEIQKLIMRGIMNIDRKTINCGLKSMLAEIKKFPPRRSVVINIAFSLCFSLYDFTRENRLDCDSIFGPKLERFNLPCTCVNIDQLYSFFAKLLDEIVSDYEKRRSYSVAVKLAADYIKKHFREDLNLTEISKNVYISPSRLSTVFKKETGIGLSKYIQKIRLEKACELLKDPEIKIYEIAWMTGFNEEKYFYSAFKKEFKTTPQKYRKTHC